MPDRYTFHDHDLHGVVLDTQTGEAKETMMANTTTRAGEVLREAAAIVDGARNQTHGDKERSFAAIAGLWEMYLRARKGGMAAGITGADVCAMMVLLKFARSEHGEHVADHGIDAAGYAAIWAELREKQS